jgi:hypothetical protein
MYAGHFASALAIRAREARVSVWPLVLGVGFLDVLFGIFVPLGIERITRVPGQGPGFRFDYIDWSHSLAMSLVWALVFGALFWRRSRVLAAWAAVAVFSHFVLDLLMHPHDLALYPGSNVRLGLGLWTLWPRGWWFFELSFIALCAAYYMVRARRVGSFGGRAGWAVGFIVVLHVIDSPWLSPTG